MPATRDLGPGEWSVLALLVEAPAHGWALAKQLSRSGEVGRVWSVGRPLVYRALETLEQRGLIEAISQEPGARGPNRTVFQATDGGRGALRLWLQEPVDHVRDVRSLFVLKLVLTVRAGLESRPLLEAQRQLVLPAVESLERRLREGTGTETVLVRFRLETTRGVLAFIDGLLDDATHLAGAPA